MWKWRWRNTVTTLMIRKRLFFMFAFCFLLCCQITDSISECKLERRGNAEQAHTVYCLWMRQARVVRQSWSWTVCCPASGWQSCLYIFQKICQLICNALPKSSTTVFEYISMTLTVPQWSGKLSDLLWVSPALLWTEGNFLEVCQLLFKESKPFR